MTSTGTTTFIAVSSFPQRDSVRAEHLSLRSETYDRQVPLKNSPEKRLRKGMFGAIANAFAGVAAALLAQEVYEECVGHVGAMDVYTLGSATLLLCISIGIRFYHVPEGTTDPVPGSTGKPVLAVDLDECCCEYVPSFIKFMNARHGTKLVLEDFTSYMFWQVPKCKLQSREHAISRVYEFHASKCITLHRAPRWS